MALLKNTAHDPGMFSSFWRSVVLLPVVCGAIHWSAPVAGAVVNPVVAVLPAGGSVPEYNVKAAYVLRFARYVEWPAATFATPRSPVVIGVLGRNPFGDALGRTAEGLKIQGRPVEVRLLAGIREARDCHAVFIARDQEREEKAWLEELRTLPILTITDSAGSLQHGSVLTLFLDESAGAARVVFSASLPAAQTAGLQLSASMLASARAVVRAGAHPEGTR